jgi:cysteine desulfurase
VLSALLSQNDRVFRLQRSVDLDNNATTAVSKPVRRAIDAVLTRHHGNPSASYGAGRSAAAILEDSRAAVARAVNAEPEEIFFTSGATEANNQVLKALCESRPRGMNRILATPIEHPSIMRSLEHLAGRGLDVAWVAVDGDGRARIDRLEEQLDSNTLLVCCMLANNEIGTIQDVASIAAVARRRGILVLSDCVQALGKIPVDVRALGIDYASFSAHKLHGPKGVGALYVKSGAPIAPQVHGGHQEAGVRAGTEGVHNIAGFAEACRAVPALLAQSGAVAAHRDSLLAELRTLEPGLAVHSPADGCLPNTLNLAFPGVSNAVLMAFLDVNGIAVSLGSACNASETTPSHVLTAIGLTAEQAGETIRISLSDRTSSRDLRYTRRVMRDFLKGKAPAIPFLRPSQLDEAFLFDTENYLLDVRFEVERRLMKGLPNSHDASVISFGRYIHHVPKEKNIVVICSTGLDATPIAYALHKRGYSRVAVLLGGVAGWQMQQPELRKRLGGTNITKLSPRTGGRRSRR